MTHSDEAPPSRLSALSQALRAVRRLRGKRSAEVAAALDLPLRSYEHFESGKGRLNVERVQLFALATESDPYAILASLWMGSPQFAARCANNKLMTILVLALQDFDRAAGDDLTTLDGQTLIAAFEKTFAELREEAMKRNGDDWLKARYARPLE
jgi:transcriptional regulator with XRE-family HTH domain